jgi:diguanylate cyclase (GGDEF)-like protein/PAS domain S-box-containing protein
MSYSQGIRGQQSWFSDWGNLLLVGLALYSVIFVTWLLAGWGSERIHATVREAGFTPLMLAGIIFAGRMALLKSVDHRYRRAWGAIALGFLCWLAADVVWAYYVIVHGDVPEVSLAYVAYMAVWVFLIIGILLFPSSPLSRSELIRYAVDYAIILVSVAVLVSYFVLGPDLVGYAAEPTLGTYIMLSYPVVGTLVILAVAGLLIRRPVAGTTCVIALLGVGLVIYSLADLLWIYLDARGMEAHAGLLYTAWFTGQLLVCVAPQRHYDVINRGVSSSGSSQHVDVLRKITPYFAAALGGAVVLTAGLPELFSRFGAIVILLLLLLILFAIRQVVTLRENARLRIEQVRQEDEARFQALVEHSSDVISVLDRDLVCRFQSPSIREVANEEPEVFIGTQIGDWVHPDDREHVEAALIRVINGEDNRVRFEWRAVHPDDRVFHVETIVSNELNNPVVNGLVLNSRDITERKYLEDVLTYQAYHDALTNLPNRASFLNTLMRAIRDIGPEDGIGLIFLDLDRFKLINDTLGHDAGDELLVHVSQHLGACLRPGDTLARLAGDEFTILLPGIRSLDEARGVANRVLRQMEDPITLAGKTVPVSCSIGVAFTDSPETEPSELLRRADTAMYAAKRNGRGRVDVFEPWMEDGFLNLERSRSIVPG